MKFPQNLRDRLKKQCDIGNMDMESALQRLEEIRETPKDELVERLAKKLLENEIIEDGSADVFADKNLNKRQQKAVLKRLIGNYESLWRRWTSGTRRIELQKINRFADENNLELMDEYRLLLRMHELAERGIKIWT